MKLLAIPFSLIMLTSSSRALICVFLLFSLLSNADDLSEPKIGYIRYDVIFRKYFDSTFFNSVISKKERRITNAKVEHERRIRDMNRHLQSIRSGRGRRPKPGEIERVKQAIEGEDAYFNEIIKNLTKDKNEFSVNYQEQFYQDTRKRVKKYADEHDILYILNGPSSWQRPNILFEGRKIKDLTDSFILYLSEKAK